MKPADGNKFRELLRAVNRVLPCATGSELDNPMLDVYWLALRHWALEDFEQACGHLLKTAKFMPTPRDFEDLRKAGRQTSGEAWALARAHASSLSVRGGFLQEQPSGNELLDAAARAVGGYKAIASASERDLQFLAPRFQEHYDAIGDREDVRAALPRIAGAPRHVLDAPVRRLLEKLS